jgi:hypothetical protein
LDLDAGHDSVGKIYHTPLERWWQSVGYYQWKGKHNLDENCSGIVHCMDEFLLASVFIMG